MLDFPVPPKGHKHERIHRHMFWPNRIDADPLAEQRRIAAEMKEHAVEEEAAEEKEAKAEAEDVDDDDE